MVAGIYAEAVILWHCRCSGVLSTATDGVVVATFRQAQKAPVEPPEILKLCGIYF